MDLISWARRVCEEQIAPLGQRLDHVRAVAELATRIAPAFPEPAGDHLIAAAWLHDVGYSPELSKTGFHPLDGARWISSADQPEIARLVAHHSGARIEARFRGIDLETEFPYVGDELDQALTYCDMLTSPRGTRTTLSRRALDVAQRYGPDDVVTRTMWAAYSDHVEAIRATQARVDRDLWLFSVRRCRAESRSNTT